MITEPVNELNHKNENARVLKATDLKPGQAAKIIGLNTADHKKLKKLMALGILPGMLLRVEQGFPFCLFRIENAQIATDRELAGDILIELKEEVT